MYIHVLVITYMQGDQMGGGGCVGTMAKNGGRLRTYTHKAPDTLQYLQQRKKNMFPNS